MTWSDVKTIKKTGYLETERHKTGRYCDVTVRIESDQQKWLKRLKSRFVKEYRTEPNFVFASPTNKVEHSMAKNIKSVLSQLFDKDYCKDFYATAVRKMWDTHFHNRKKFKDSVFNSHLQQTGHTANTALHSYVVPAERSEAIQVYIDELSKLQDLSIEDEVTVQLETTISTPKVKSGCKPPKSVDATPCSSIHSPVPTMRNPRQRDNRQRPIAKATLKSTAQENDDSDYDRSEPSESEEENEKQEVISNSTTSSKSCKQSVSKRQREECIRSLKTFRKTQPSDELVKALELFHYANCGLTKKDMVRIMKEGGIKITSDLVRKVHQKVKGALCDYLTDVDKH